MPVVSECERDGIDLLAHVSTGGFDAGPDVLEVGLQDAKRRRFVSGLKVDCIGATMDLVKYQRLIILHACRRLLSCMSDDDSTLYPCKDYLR